MRRLGEPRRSRRRPCGAALCVLLCASLVCVAAPPARAQDEPGAAPEPSVVYGIEFESRGPRERVLVFADAPLVARIEEPDPETAVLVLKDADLDPSAPREVVPEVGGSVLHVGATSDAAARVVRIAIRRAPNARPTLSQRGATLAVDFPRVVSPERRIALQFRAADIAEVVQTVARETGEPFVFDSSLKGRVTLIVWDRVSREEALALLDAALLGIGFAAVPTPGGPRRIMAIEAAGTRAPYALAPPDAGGGAPVTTLVRLAFASPTDLATALAPLAGRTSLVLPLEASRGVLLSGPEANLARLIVVIRAFDRAEAERLMVLRLREADPETAAQFVRDRFGEDDPIARVRVVADSRSRALVVTGPDDQLDAVREFVRSFDQPADFGGGLFVVRVRHAQPEDLAQLIRGLASGASAPDDAAAGLLGADFQIAVDEPTSSLVVRADPGTAARLRELIDELDRPPPAVSVEAMVFEVTTAEGLALGFDAFIPIVTPDSLEERSAASILLDPRDDGFINPATTTAQGFGARYSRSPLLIPIVNPTTGETTNLLVPRETVVTTATGDDIALQVLMRPHLVLASGEAQEIFAGDNIPIPVARTAADGTSNPLQVQQSIERHDVGVRLRVEPTVGQAGKVTLALDVEASALARTQNASTRVGPTIQQRRVSATVHLNDGEFAVVGVGKQAERTATESGTPWLKDIPILGNLFRFTEDVVREVHLVVAVQAWIHRTPEELEAETIRRRLGFQRQQARLSPIANPGDAPFAVRVATRSRGQVAAAIARELTSAGHVAQVSAWEAESGPLFDVVVTGFETLADAGQAARKLRAHGRVPEVVVLPQAFRRGGA